MITAHKIGYYGQLGNQMFQYAMLLGVSEKKGYEVIIPDNRTIKLCGFESKPLYYGLRLYDCFMIPEKITANLPPIQYVFYEKQHHFDPDVFNVPDHTSFIGHFETEKYFSHASERVKQSFRFLPEIQAEAEKRLKEITRSDKQKVALHVRRTHTSDIQQHHPLIPLEFYWSAIKRFPKEEYDIVLFSNDIEWCEQMLRAENIVYQNQKYNDKTDFVDLCMMTLCDHHILSNSTFGWWGAWLANKPRQIVYAPCKWFGPALSHKRTDDIIPERWTLL